MVMHIDFFFKNLYIQEMALGRAPPPLDTELRLM